MEVKVRPATHEDRAPVLEFCRNTWEGGDYIDSVWDEWISQSDGILLAADLNGVAMGICHAKEVGPGEGWVEGLRVSPGHRRRGAAKALVLRSVDHLKGRGCRVVRLTTAMDNLASRSLFGGLGFIEVARFLRFEGKTGSILRAFSPSVRDADPSDAEGIWGMLKSSPTFERTAGLLSTVWTWRELNREVLAEYLGERLVLILEGRDGVEGLLLYRRRASSKGSLVEVSYLDGTETGIQELLQELSRLAHESGITRVALFAPDLPTTVQAVESLGLEPIITMVVMEMLL